MTKKLPKVVMPHGSDPKILRAAKQVADDGEIHICLLGSKEEISSVACDLGITSLRGIEIIDPSRDSRVNEYADIVYELRKRKGISRTMSHQLISDHNYFAAVMLQQGAVDALVNGVNTAYADSVRPLLEIVGAEPGKTLAGVYMMVKEQSLSFFADCTVNIDPSAEELAGIALATAELAKKYTSDPIRVAMLSFSSFGSSKHEFAKQVAKAVSLVKARAPNLEIDGEMQADVALNIKLREKEFPFNTLKGNANVLVFPNLGSANIAYKLLQNVGDVEVTGPVLVGLRKSGHTLPHGASVNEIANMIYVSAHQAMVHRGKQ